MNELMKDAMNRHVESLVKLIKDEMIKVEDVKNDIQHDKEKSDKEKEYLLDRLSEGLKSDTN